MRISVAGLVFAAYLLSTQPAILEPYPSFQQTSDHEAPARKSPCWQKAFNQLAMNECAAQDFRESDAELNKVYQEVLSKYAGDEAKVARIKRAQRVWVQFRDAEADSLYPAAEQPRHGSAWVMCRPLELARLTQERTKQLRGVLEHKEGDVCSE